MNITKYFKKKEIKKVLNFMIKDKKNLNNKINLILINRIGRATKPNNVNVSLNEIKSFLSSFY